MLLFCQYKLAQCSNDLCVQVVSSKIKLYNIPIQNILEKNCIFESAGKMLVVIPCNRTVSDEISHQLYIIRVLCQIGKRATSAGKRWLNRVWHSRFLCSSYSKISGSYSFLILSLASVKKFGNGVNSTFFINMQPE